MTEALITNLAQIGSLRVISRTSVMRYRSTDKSLPQIGRELNVDAVLEGSVQRSGARVLVTAQLIHAGTDRHLWARSYERDLKDLLTLQGEIARAVAGEIRVALSPQEEAVLAKAQPVDPEVHESYLRGRLHVSKGTESGITEGIKHFEQALARDPTYARAYAGLADAYFLLSDTYRAPVEVLPKAKAAAIKALDLDQSLAEAHTSLGLVHLFRDWDWKAAESQFQRAVELNPSYALAHDFYGALLVMAFGRLEEGAAEARKARELDPLSPQVHVDTGWWVHFLARQYDEAIAQNLKAIELEPGLDLAYAQLAAAYAAAGRSAEALAALEKAPLADADDSALALAMASSVYASTGERDKARQALFRLEEIAKRRYVCPYEIGAAYVTLGDQNEAFRWLERGFQGRSACMPGTKRDPRFDPIRSDPRYLDLLRRIGFAP
jgi:tetratricopeptide (TPR) repeat protein